MMSGRFSMASGTDIRLFARAWADIAKIDLALRRRGLQGVIGQIERSTVMARRNIAPREMRRARRYARRIQQASHYYPFHAECLHRSLVLQKWLKSEGYPSELRIGVRKAAGDLKAHAWVEIGGLAVSDEQAAVSEFTLLEHPQRSSVTSPTCHTDANH